MKIKTMNSKFKSLTLNELKAELKKSNAKVSGIKKQLVEMCIFPFYLPKYFYLPSPDIFCGLSTIQPLTYLLSTSKIFYFHSTGHKESHLDFLP